MPDPSIPAPSRQRATGTVPPSAFTFEPMTGGGRPAAALDTLLKRPGQLIHQLHHEPSWRLVGTLAAVTLLCLTLYGLTVGSFSGGVQWVAAPLKIVAGTALSALICLPSLYIFTCLSGADVRLRPLAGLLVAVLCLNSLLLIGLAPVAWVFSQSSNSVPFIGGLHLVFWMIGAVFALRLLAGLFEYVRANGQGYLYLWFAVFLLVCLQMTTALRPIVGTADTFVPTKKLFFLSHWSNNLSGDPQ